MHKPKWFEFTVPLAKNTRASRYFSKYVKKLQRALHVGAPTEEIMELRAVMLDDSSALPLQHQAVFRASALLLTDLALLKWRLRISRCGKVSVAAPATNSNRELNRKTIRAQELIKRNAQLAQHSVKEFIKSMERKRLNGSRFTSIFDLMRNGPELAEKLRFCRAIGNDNTLSSAVSPYLQFVDSHTRCDYTGLRLMDIWRYFRHTWTNQYKSVPGRSMMILVRDAAAPNHPVMGIAAISSPIIQISERDKWIGWHAETFLERIQSRPTSKLAHWIVETVDEAIDEIYKADFIRERVISQWSVQHPTQADVQRLREYATKQKQRHLRYGRPSDFRARKTADLQDRSYWKEQACTPLFCSKRAESLASLLEARIQLQQHFGSRLTAKKLESLVETSRGRRLVRKVLRKAKGDKVGVAMADITVCGAIQPYNAILVGKLVSMLAVSPAVVAEYKKRYCKTASQIASSMAGRPIIRKPNLVYLGTTSLYGNGSSQYNRIKIPADIWRGDSSDSIVFQELGDSESFGTSQFSDETVDALVEYLRQSTNGERVNNIFGEGVSPRLRKVREGLDLMGMPSTLLLQHGRHRSVYGVLLAKNACDYLLGIDRRPEYLFSINSTGSVEAIVAWWYQRWLYSRIQSDSVLSQVEQHDHSHPICHGARVTTGTIADTLVETLEGVSNASA